MPDAVDDHQSPERSISRRCGRRRVEQSAFPPARLAERRRAAAGLSSIADEGLDLECHVAGAGHHVHLLRDPPCGVSV